MCSAQFTIADITKLNPSLVQTSGDASMKGKWKVGSRSGVPIALIKDGTSTTMAVAEIIGFDSGTRRGRGSLGLAWDGRFHLHGGFRA